MDKMYKDISVFMDSRQTIAGMTDNIGVILKFFCRESSFIFKYLILSSHISFFAQRVKSKKTILR